MKNYLLLSGILGSFLFIFVSMIDGLTRPYYISTYHFISHLGLGERSWLGNSSSIVIGLLFLVFSYRLSQIRIKGNQINNIYYLLLSIGLIGSAIFVMDPIMGYPPGTEFELTFRGRLHDAFSILIIFSLISNCFYWSKLFKKMNLSGLSHYSLISGIMIMVSVIILGLLLLLEFLMYNNLPLGVFERILFYTGFIWNFYISFWLFKQQQRKDQSTKIHV